MTVLGPFWDQLVTTGVLASVTGYLLKSFISQSLKRWDDLPEKIGELKSEIAVISKQLESLDTIEHIVHEHSKVIAVLEALLGANRRSDGNHKKPSN